MTKSIFTVLIALIVSSQVNAQVDVIYGNTLYQKDFLGQLNTMKAHKYGRPMQFVGVAGTNLMANKKKNVHWNFVGAKYLSQNFQVNDSVSGKISGSLFGFAAGRDLFAKVDAFDFHIGGGLNFGRLKLVGNDLLHLKNMFISPKLSVLVKVRIGKLCLSAGAEYAYDISGSDWKEKIFPTGKRSTVAVSGFNQSGMNFTVGLGWRISD
jgi:hypothetical protein